MALDKSNDKKAPALTRNHVSIQLIKTEAELLLEALELLPVQRRTMVFDRLKTNVSNVKTLWDNAEKVQHQRKIVQQQGKK